MLEDGPFGWHLLAIRMICFASTRNKSIMPSSSLECTNEIDHVQMHHLQK